MKVKHIVEAEAGGLRAFKDLALFEIMDLIDLTTSNNITIPCSKSILNVEKEKYLKIEKPKRILYLQKKIHLYITTLFALSEFIE